MQNVIEFAVFRRHTAIVAAETERRAFRSAVAEIAADIDVRANLEEIEAIAMHTAQADLRNACGRFLEGPNSADDGRKGVLWSFPFRLVQAGEQRVNSFGYCQIVV